MVLVSVLVSIGPVFVSIKDGRFRHSWVAITAYRAARPWFMRFSAVIQPRSGLLWEQEVPGSNPGAPIVCKTLCCLLIGRCHL